MENEDAGLGVTPSISGKAGRILRPNNQDMDMARGMDPFKELDAKQTNQFLANLNDPRHIQRSLCAIERVRKLRFTVIE